MGRSGYAAATLEWVFGTQNPLAFDFSFSRRVWSRASPGQDKRPTNGASDGLYRPQYRP